MNKNISLLLLLAAALCLVATTSAAIFGPGEVYSYTQKTHARADQETVQVVIKLANMSSSAALTFGTEFSTVSATTNYESWLTGGVGLWGQGRSTDKHYYMHVNITMTPEALSDLSGTWAYPVGTIGYVRCGSATPVMVSRIPVDPSWRCSQ
mmetsp:Transcript_27924/g.70049  ORF Transcript_27924/g.70049 Transcript_27924/m.70049 type:complete len:152 (+) Transcript_27924:40-495(+)|eukprot:CAMPEP_0177635478 /NCGR_PEP_ID=MMETSP0447-20121125/3925_1 /TAXON_ID=0 /ORGANISM="Stygamoeba regulata, Strain BSH-02190019" /LENGTH=151 /DNA_ID=CAMNT_0019137273 /DNA_START=40 /DNA_END=495 /DNA_ORIENTATION=-